MDSSVIIGLLIPFIGTALGSACVLFMRGNLNRQVQRALTGFAAGVMVAASVWSLLIPSMDQSEHMGKFAFVPAVVGFLLGIAFLLILDMVIPHLHMNAQKAEGPKSRLARTTMMVLAVTLHNIPEGIAIQNFPEGAIISMPLHAEGKSKFKAFLDGTLSGIVEPVAGFITILAAGLVVPVLPYLLSFAAGAMLYVVVEELIPEMSEGEHSNIGVIMFSVGFALMMALDVALG